MTEDWYFWQTNSNAIILDDSVPADCLEMVANHIEFQKIRLSPRPPPKVTLKCVAS